MNLSCASAPHINDVVMMAAPGVILNPWADDAFSQATLTDDVNRNPVAPRQVSSLGWNEKGVTGKTIAIDLKDGGLDIVDSAPYNGVPTELTLDDGESIPLNIPSHPARSVLYAAEVASRRAHGTVDPETVEARLAEHYEKHNSAHALTHEVDRIGALQGLVPKRANGVKYDLGAAFGRAPLQKTADFANVNFDPIDFFRSLVDEQGEKSDGAMIEGWTVLVDSVRMRQLSTNKFVRDIWKSWQSTLITADMRTRGWEITEGVFVRQYMNNANVPGSNPVRKIFAPQMLVVPQIQGNLQTRFAPRQAFGSIGDEGVPVYMIGTPAPRGESIELYSESNHIHYVKRLELNTVVTQTV